MCYRQRDGKIEIMKLVLHCKLILVKFIYTAHLKTTAADPVHFPHVFHIYMSDTVRLVTVE